MTPEDTLSSKLKHQDTRASLIDTRDMTSAQETITSYKELKSQKGKRNLLSAQAAKIKSGQLLHKHAK